MSLFSFLPDQTKIPFMTWRKIAGGLSLAMVIGSLVLVATSGLNFGIDFLGGTLIEVKTNGAQIDEFRDRLGDLDLGEVGLQEFGAPDDLLIRAQRQDGDEAAQLEVLETIRQAIGNLVVEYRRTEFVGPTIGSELREAAFFATISALLAVMIYIWFRFEWQFGIASALALIHDLLITIGFFALTGLEFNLASVAALLTIAGYSINDTVVIFDRVRENIRKFKKLPLIDLLNRSLNDTLKRTLLTSLTTELALITLAVFGGEVIRGFVLALMFGVFIGTWSSVFVAVPVLTLIRPRRSSEEEGRFSALKTGEKTEEKNKADE